MGRLRALTALLLCSFVVCSLVVNAEGAEPLARHVLADFEAGAPGWRLNQVEARLDAGWAGDGVQAWRLRFPAWRSGGDPWPSVMLDYGEGGFWRHDWGQYDALVFEVESRHRRPLLLKLRLDDADGNRALRLFRLPPGRPYTCRVPIAELAQAIDVSRVVHFNLYMTRPPEEALICLDAVRLEAYGLDAEAAALADDPLGRGRVALKLDLGRRGLVDIEVRDAAGRTVGRQVAYGGGVHWRQSVALPPGPYGVGMTVRDVDHDGGDRAIALGNFVVLPARARPRLAVWTEPAVRKLGLDARPRPGQGQLTGGDTLQGVLPPVRLDMARNEYEAFQIVLLSAQDEKALHLRSAGAQGPAGATLPAAAIKMYQVGYVHTKPTDLYAVERSGWWADPLLPLGPLELEAGTSQPLWIEVKTPAGAPPGRYRGTVDIYRAQRRIGQVPFEIRLFEATLPDTNAVGTAFSFYPHSLDMVYEDDGGRALQRQYWEFLAEHRLGLTHIYRGRPPGADELDFIQSQSATRFAVLNLPTRQYRPQELEAIGDMLEPTIAALKRRGLLQRAYLYGFDEAHVEDRAWLDQAFGYFKRRFPGLATVTTARHPAMGSEAVDLWVPLLPLYDETGAAQVRQLGRQVWWYICISPTHPFPNVFIEYPALEGRLLWWMTYQQQVPGVLYYSVNRWPQRQEPLRLSGGGGRTGWDPASYATANGDGSLLYGGPQGPLASIRLKMIRDGIEDYGLLYLLAQACGDGGAQGRQLCRELIAAPDVFVEDPGALREVRRRLLTLLEEGSP